MRKQRKTYGPEEKVAIIRKHLLDGVAVSDLCDEHGLHPTGYYLSLPIIQYALIFVDF